MDIDGCADPAAHHGGGNQAGSDPECGDERIAGNGCGRRGGTGGCGGGSRGQRGHGGSVGINGRVPEGDRFHGGSNHGKRHHRADAGDHRAFHGNPGPRAHQRHAHNAATDSKQSAQESHDGADARAARWRQFARVIGGMLAADGEQSKLSHRHHHKKRSEHHAKAAGINHRAGGDTGQHKDDGRRHDPSRERPFDLPRHEVATVRRGGDRHIAEHGSALQLLLVGADEDGGQRDDPHRAADSQ